MHRGFLTTTPDCQLRNQGGGCSHEYTISMGRDITRFSWISISHFCCSTDKGRQPQVTDRCIMWL